MHLAGCFTPTESISTKLRGLLYSTIGSMNRTSNIDVKHQHCYDDHVVCKQNFKINQRTSVQNFFIFHAGTFTNWIARMHDYNKCMTIAREGGSGALF